MISFDGDTIYVHAVGTATALTTQSPDLLFSSLAVGTVPTTGGLVVAIGGDELFGGTVGDVGAGVVYLLSSQYALNAGVTLRTLTNFQENTLYGAAVSPDGSSVAFGDYDSQIWFSSIPAANSTIPETSSLTVDPSNYQSVYGVAYSPKNGRYLAVAAGEDADLQSGDVDYLGRQRQEPLRAICGREPTADFRRLLAERKRGRGWGVRLRQSPSLHELSPGLRERRTPAAAEDAPALTRAGPFCAV